MLKHTCMMSSDSSAAAVFRNGGEVISCQNTPVVAVGGVLQLTEQRLWLFTPLTQFEPGSVAELPSVSANSAPPQPRIHSLFVDERFWVNPEAASKLCDPVA